MRVLVAGGARSSVAASSSVSTTPVTRSAAEELVRISAGFA
jgi:hypothetical protein